MKLVTAIIKPFKLDDVRAAFIGIPGRSRDFATEATLKGTSEATLITPEISCVFS